MKRFYMLLVCLISSGLAFSQAPLKLANGQKIVIESSTTIEASLAMGMELNSTSTAINALEVKAMTDKNCNISHTMTKLKLTMNMMGQPSLYDSENKEGNNAEMAKIFDDRLNNPVEITIDNRTGMAVTETKTVKKKEAEETNPADDLIKMFSNNSNEAIVEGAFEIIPIGKTIGDRWADTTIAKEMKMIRTYNLKSITGNEAVIQLEINSSSVNKLDFQEMEFEIKSETKTKSEITTDITTGLAKQRTSSTDITGSIQMMGQDMPISAKVSSTNIYK